MGSYGIGPGRVMAAAVEQRHDEHGISWPRRSRRTTCTSSCCRAWRSRPRRPRSSSPPPGATCCSTTASCAPGEKFADADLIGLPVRVTVGKKTLEDGMVDVRDRATGAERRVDVAELGKEAFSDGEAT